jgi:hypothetical protein
MISLSSLTWPSATWPSAILPRSRCKSRSSTRAAPARRRPSGCARARGLLPRRTGRTRRRGGLRCNRFRHRDSRGRAGTADKGKSARSRNSRNRPAPPAPGRQSSDRDIFAIWDQGRWVFARRVPFSLSCQATEANDETMSERRCSPPSPGGGRSIGGLRPPSFYVKNADAERRLCEARRDGVKARTARCESLHRRAPHPASLRAATVPLQGRVKKIVLATHPRPSFAARTKATDVSPPNKMRGGGAPEGAN